MPNHRGLSERFAGPARAVATLAMVIAGCSTDPVTEDDSCEGDSCDQICRPAADPEIRCGGRPVSPNYDCPLTVKELNEQYLERGKKGRRDWCWHADGGNFDHRGICFREVIDGPGGGQQCCYDLDTGVDNCTGTYDEIGVAEGSNRHEDVVKEKKVAGSEYEFGICDFDVLGADAWAKRHCNIDVRPWCDVHCATACVTDSVFAKPEDCAGFTDRASCASQKKGFLGSHSCRWAATDCALEFTAVGGEPGSACSEFAPPADVGGTVDECDCGFFDGFVPLKQDLYDEGMRILQDNIAAAEERNGQ